MAVRVRREEELYNLVRLGQRIKEERIKLKRTQEEIAESTGLAPSTISSIELARVGLRGYCIIDMMRYLREVGLKLVVVPEE